MHGLKRLAGILVGGALFMGGTAQAAPVATGVLLGVAIQGLAPLTVGGIGSIDVTGAA